MIGRIVAETTRNSMRGCYIRDLKSPALEGPIPSGVFPNLVVVLGQFSVFGYKGLSSRAKPRISLTVKSRSFAALRMTAKACVDPKIEF
jgi:hypothetical protein